MRVYLEHCQNLHTGVEQPATYCQQGMPRTEVEPQSRGPCSYRALYVLVWASKCIGKSQLLDNLDT